jgi:serine/threonine protein kinase, bacterial
MEKILQSRYKIVKFIGKGGFGKTYLAEDLLMPSEGSKCVVKQLYLAIDNEAFLDTARRLFKTEAETLQKVGTHNCIPRLLAYFENENQFYLVQQYIEGHTLSQELNSGQIWTEAQVISLLKDCLNILDFIHAQGVIHRDVKPDNLIRRSQDGKLVLVDFGTVKEVIIAQTQFIPSTVAVGTRGYMPTEQALGKPRITSDIYALGMIAIQALTGSHPLKFQENDEGEIIWHSQTPIRTELANIISQMVRYHFKDRYQSARKVLEAIDSISINEPSAISPQSRMYTPTMQVNSSQFSKFVFTDRQEIEPTTSKQNSTQNFSTNNISSQTEISQPTNFSSVKNQSNSIPNYEAKPQFSSINHTNTSQQDFSVQSNPESQPQKWFKSPILVTAGTAIFIGAAAMGGMYLLNDRNIVGEKQNRDETILRLESLYQEQKYSDCYEILTAASDSSTLNSITLKQKTDWEAKCGLAIAAQKAEILDFTQALAIANKLPKNAAIASAIKTSIKEWSDRTLKEAIDLYDREGKLKEALEKIQAIPQNTAAKTKAFKLLASWKTEDAANQKILAQSQKYLRQERWQDAKNEADKLQNSRTDYWQQQGQEIISKAKAELEAKRPPEKSSSITPRKIEPKNSSTNIDPPALLKEDDKEIRDLGDTPSKEDDKEIRDLGDTPLNEDKLDDSIRNL